MKLGEGIVSWSSKKQPIVALSSAEAEYIAATHAAKEILWLRALLTELGRPPTGPTTLHVDNQSAIAIAKDPKFHARTKHIDVRYHFIRDVVRSAKVAVTYIPTNENLADAFTKPLPRTKFEIATSRMGLRAA